jgi:hypothetical protein
MTPRYYILSDFEMDDIDSRAQIEGIRSVPLRYEALEADLLEAVREINGNVIKLNPNS